MFERRGRSRFPSATEKGGVFEEVFGSVGSKYAVRGRFWMTFRRYQSVTP